MPAKGQSKLTDEQRRKIAVGRLAGKTAKEIAPEVGRHPVSVARIAIDHRTQTMILGLKKKSEADFEKIWSKMVKTLHTDIASKDFNERSVTRAQFTRLLTAGEPTRIADLGGSGGDFTLEELLGTMRTIRTQE